MACLRKIEGATRRDRIRNEEIFNRLNWNNRQNTEQAATILWSTGIISCNPYYCRSANSWDSKVWSYVCLSTHRTHCFGCPESDVLAAIFEDALICVLMHNCLAGCALPPLNRHVFHCHLNLTLTYSRMLLKFKEMSCDLNVSRDGTCFTWWRRMFNAVGPVSEKEVAKPHRRPWDLYFIVW